MKRYTHEQRSKLLLEAKNLRNSGESIARIAKKIGISIGTTRAWLGLENAKRKANVIIHASPTPEKRKYTKRSVSEAVSSNRVLCFFATTEELTRILKEVR